MPATLSSKRLADFSRERIVGIMRKETDLYKCHRMAEMDKLMAAELGSVEHSRPRS
jgi:hypothetical protein